MSELPGVTRNYVVLGLLLVTGVGLAAREHALRSEHRGARDEWDRVLLVTEDGEAYIPYDHRAGFDFSFEKASDVVAAGRELLDDPEASPLTAATAYADEHGHGLLLVDLREDWDLSPLAADVPPNSMYAAISIGDVAREGTRVSFGAPEIGPFKYVLDDSMGPPRDMLDVTAIQLALLEHPDVRALFEDPIRGEPAQRSRWALDHGMGFQYRREALQAQQRRLAEVDELWPSQPGDLGDRWQQVRATPTVGGVIVEILPTWLNVKDSVRSAVLHSEPIGQLAFVPNEALAPGADPIGARRPCVELIERYTMPDTIVESYLDSSPDGQLLAVSRSTTGSLVDVYRVVVDPIEGCELEWVRTAAQPPSGKPKPSNSGNLAAFASPDALWWRDTLEQHFILFPDDIDQRTGPWWASDDLLVMLGECGKEVVIGLLRTGIVNYVHSSDAPRALLDARTLFPKLDRSDPAGEILDVRPVTDGTLFVITKACPRSHGLGDDRLQRPCMHRVRFRPSLHDRVGDEPTDLPRLVSRRGVDVRTLGPIDSYGSLSIAADGTRAAWVTVDPMTADRAPELVSVAIGEISLGPIERIEADVHPDAKLRLGPDGRVVVVESPIQIEGYGSRMTARAFLLAPPRR